MNVDQHSDVIDLLEKIQISMDSNVENIKQIVKDCNDLGVSDQFLNLYADSFNVMHKRNRQLMDHLKTSTIN